MLFSQVQRAIFLMLVFLSTALWGGWTPSETISSPGEYARWPQIAVDSQGNAAAVWVMEDINDWVVRGAFKPFNGDWQEPINIVQSEDHVNDIEIAVDHEGTVYAAWTRNLSSSQVIQVAVKRLDESWQTPVTISSVGQSANIYQICIDSGNNVTLLFSSYNGTTWLIKEVTKPYNGIWQTPVVISDGGSSASSPQMYIAQNGVATAVWKSFSGSEHIIQAADRTSGGSWGSPYTVTDSLQLSFDPQVVMDSAGNTLVVWRDANDHTIKSRTRPQNGAWQAITTISHPGDNASQPHLVIDSQGNATAMWVAFNGVNSLVQSATKPFSQDWLLPVDVSDAGKDTSGLQIAANPSGDIAAIWYYFDSSLNQIIQTSTKKFGQQWLTPVVLSIPEWNSDYAQIAMDSRGYSFAVWDSNDGVNHIVQSANNYEAPPVPVQPAPPRDFKGNREKNSFVCQAEYAHHLEWRPSVSSNVVSYLLYRDGRLLRTFSPRSKFSYRVRNQSRNKKVVYNLVAQDDQGTQSEAVSVIIR